MLYRPTGCRCRRGAPMKNLSHTASFESLDKNAPSKAGTKHLTNTPGILIKRLNLRTIRLRKYALAIAAQWRYFPARPQFKAYKLVEGSRTLARGSDGIALGPQLGVGRHV